MNKFIKALFIFLFIILLGYALITQNLEVFPFLHFFIGAYWLIEGILMLKNDKKVFLGYLNIIISISWLLLSLNGF